MLWCQIHNTSTVIWVLFIEPRVLSDNNFLNVKISKLNALCLWWFRNEANSTSFYQQNTPRWKSVEVQLLIGFNGNQLIPLPFSYTKSRCRLLDGVDVHIKFALNYHMQTMDRLYIATLTELTINYYFHERTVVMLSLNESLIPCMRSRVR